MDPPVKRRELVLPVAGKPWFHACHEALFLFESKILSLQTL
jgi:hypothetical protein